MKQFLITLLGLCLFNADATYASETKTTTTISCAFEPGELQMGSFLEACPFFSNATPSNRIHTEALGKVINYNGNLYEIRVESFEDPTGQLPLDITFYEYAVQNDLLGMHSHKVHPLPGICFESFDFRHAKLHDDVYFSIVLRKIEG